MNAKRLMTVGKGYKKETEVITATSLNQFKKMGHI